MKQDLDAERSGHRDGEADLVFDFSETGCPDLGALCLMLTARNLADEDHRRVWLHGLPESTWRTLQAIGLGHYFELLPFTEDLAN
jgi:hypothetical protein